VRAGAHLEAVYFDARASDDAHSPSGAALSAAAAAGVRLIELADGVLDRVSDAVTPQPVLAVATLPDTDLASMPATGFVLVLADVRDPGNLGTAIRAADAAGAAAVVACGQCVDVFNPKTLRATAGSVFHLPVLVAPTLRETVDALHASSRTVLGAVVAGGEALWHATLDAGASVVIGAEATGLRDEDLELLDGTLTIEMAGRAESLNAGVAAALVCFEALRRRADPSAAGPTI